MYQLVEEKFFVFVVLPVSKVQIRSDWIIREMVSFYTVMQFIRSELILDQGLISAAFTSPVSEVPP